MSQKKQLIEAVNSAAEFNKWANIKVLEATEGAVEIQIEWRKEFGQYSGYLHAGMIGALIDTACGFAAATVAGTKLLASNFSVNCLRPAVGEKFIAKATVIKLGKAQIFTACDLYAVAGGEQKLVANGQTLLCVLVLLILFFCRRLLNSGGSNAGSTHRLTGGTLRQSQHTEYDADERAVVASSRASFKTTHLNQLNSTALDVIIDCDVALRGADALMSRQTCQHKHADTLICE